MRTTEKNPFDFRATTNKKNNAIKPNRGSCPARGLARMEMKESFFWVDLSTKTSSTTAAAGEVRSLCGAGRLAVLAAGLLLAFLPRASAITGTVATIVLPSATDDELDETIGPPGLLVFRSSDPKDVRIFNGYTPGGISLWNFSALTNPPESFPHDISMNGHHVELDGSYSLNAEAGRMNAWYGTNVVWTLIAAEDAADSRLLSAEPDGSNMSFTVATTTNTITVETCSSLVDPVWEPADFTLERLTELTVKITVASSPEGEMRYIRILLNDRTAGMFIFIPLSVPSLLVGGAEITSNLVVRWNSAYGWGDHSINGYLTEETDPDFSISAAAGITTNLIASWNEAHGWGNHADAGYLTEETDPDFSVSAAAGITTNMIALWNALVTFPGFTDLDTDYGVNLGTMAGEDAENYMASDALDGDVAVGGDLQVLGGPGTTGTNFAKVMLGRTNTDDFAAGQIFFSDFEGDWNCLQYYDGDMTFGGFALWKKINGTNVWYGRISDPESSRIAQSYAGDTSLGTGTNITLTGTTYAYSASPSNAYTLSVATNAARFVYSVTIFGTNTCTLPANFILRGTATAGGTNEVTFKPYGATNWFVFWRGQ